MFNTNYYRSSTILLISIIHINIRKIKNFNSKMVYFLNYQNNSTIIYLFRLSLLKLNLTKIYNIRKIKSL